MDEWPLIIAQAGSPEVNWIVGVADLVGKIGTPTLFVIALLTHRLGYWVWDRDLESLRVFHKRELDYRDDIIRELKDSKATLERIVHRQAGTVENVATKVLETTPRG